MKNETSENYIWDSNTKSFFNETLKLLLTKFRAFYILDFARIVRALRNLPPKFLDETLKWKSFDHWISVCLWIYYFPLVIPQRYSIDWYISQNFYLTFPWASYLDAILKLPSSADSLCIFVDTPDHQSACSMSTFFIEEK